MKLPRGFLILCALILLGVCIGLLLSKWQWDDDDKGITTESSSGEMIIRFPDVPDQMPTAWSVTFTDDAIPGEMIIHLTSRKDYLDYLKILTNAGLAPLGQIDELLVVRIGKDAMSGPNPGFLGGQGSFSYRVERPLPPVAVAP